MGSVLSHQKLSCTCLQAKRHLLGQMAFRMIFHWRSPCAKGRYWSGLLWFCVWLHRVVFAHHRLCWEEQLLLRRLCAALDEVPITQMLQLYISVSPSFNSTRWTAKMYPFCQEALCLLHWQESLSQSSRLSATSLTLCMRVITLQCQSCCSSGADQHCGLLFRALFLLET